MKNGYKYVFNEDVPSNEIESTVLLAVMAAESLHGRSRVRLDAAYRFDRERRVCVIDAGSDVGRDIVGIFTGYILHEFGEDSFKVHRIVDTQKPQPVEAASSTAGAGHTEA